LLPIAPLLDILAATTLLAQCGQGGFIMAQVKTVKEYFDTLPSRFVPDRIDPTIYQYEISGEGGGTWHAIVEERTVKVAQGPHANPTLTFKASAPDWLTFVHDPKQQFQPLYFQGKLQVIGDQLLAFKHNTVFPPEK
jgi:hypothetical protein